MTPSPLLRFARHDPPPGAPPALRPVDGMAAPSFTILAAWLTEIDRQGDVMRARQPLYQRFDRTARTLTPGRIRGCDDAEALSRLEGRLRQARRPGGHDLHGLDRVWSRAELGALITEATNRRRQLALGRMAIKPTGPRLDPRRLPDDRLEHLIQHHRDLIVVEALRAERRRRENCGGAHACP